ncbi:helix-turn-helix transcriptional regulator [Bradyrhizobium zhanjiangense]|uniref:helix-turn-helix transcriptional regulator n=1 Tax=Bradyrhizobium zhanjiangense TaxID=1325107 RepID=UPI001008F341|nr:LuxR family transcriptional regulator [Bradyrhizobium zhanjiangense]
MYRAFQTFIERLTESTDPDAARQAMAEIASALSLSCFAYLALPRESVGVPYLISTYPPSWTAHYLTHHYESVDPIIRRAIRDMRPFRWGLGLGPPIRSALEHELFEEAASFGICCGFTIPIHDKGAIAAVTFATDRSGAQFERSVTERADVLQLIARYFHAHAKVRGRSDRVVHGVLLSRREFECLEWYSQGKSMSDIGTILRISRRTVAFHLVNVRAKLGVRSICQAVAYLEQSKARR